MRELIESVCNASLPWKSLDAIELFRYPCVDTQEQIDRCCECSLPECIDCLSNSYKQKQRRIPKRKKIDHENLEMLVCSGASEKEVCETLGVSRPTYYRAKKKYQERIKKNESK